MPLIVLLVLLWCWLYELCYQRAKEGTLFVEVFHLCAEAVVEGEGKRRKPQPKSMDGEIQTKLAPKLHAIHASTMKHTHIAHTPTIRCCSHHIYSIAHHISLLFVVMCIADIHRRQAPIT